MNNHSVPKSRSTPIRFEAVPASAADKPSIAYELSGRGPAIIFVHGLTYNRSMWGPTIQHLKNSFTCVAVDLPGHGESADAAIYSLESVARSLHNLIVCLNLDAPILVGHSAGAILASLYAASYPTAGVVTSDQMLRTTEFIKRLQGMRAQLESPAFPVLWRAIESTFGVELIPEPDRQLILKNSNPRQEVALGYWREILICSPQEMETRFRSFLSKIQQPFTAVFGGDVAPGYRAWVNAVIPHHELVVFSNAGHFPHLVDPQQFASVVRRVAATAVTHPIAGK